MVLKLADWQTPEKENEPAARGRGTAKPQSAERRENVRNEAKVDSLDGAPDDESIAATIRSYLDRLAQVEDPVEVNRLRRIYRRTVPLHLRSHLAAFLLREATGGGAQPTRKGTPRAASRATPNATPKGDRARLFINAGRNRRIYPDDIYDLFASQLEIKRSDIAEVRVMDNYSFVEIQSRDAERAIAELTGKELKGRKLSVNYARPREEKQRE
jgi:RNA recognition motif-containing protein